jgi:hypothetical protein
MHRLFFCECCNCTLTVFQSNKVQDEKSVVSCNTSGLRWLSWTYRDKHLPEDFHKDEEQYERLTSWLVQRPYMSQQHVPQGQDAVILMCLAIGLVLRDLHAVHYVYGEPGVVVEDSALHVQESSLGWGELQALLRECTRLKNDIRRCFGLEAERQDTPPLPKDQGKAGESSKDKHPGRKHAVVAKE